MPKKNRPKINIPLTTSDLALEGITILALGLLFGLPFFSYAGLPDEIPIHFNFKGQPDGYGSKGFLWLLPILGAAMSIGFTILSKIPHSYNYPVEITERNALPLYTGASRMMRTMKALIIGLFAYITFSTIQVAKGTEVGLSTYVLIFFFGALFGVIGFNLYKSTKVA